jgi:hypothetical protein
LEPECDAARRLTSTTKLISASADTCPFQPVARLERANLPEDKIMTFRKSVPAPNRRLPPDDVIKADVDAGLSIRAIGCKHGVSNQSVRERINRMGWRDAEKAAAKAAAAAALAAAERRYPTDTPAKVVRKRDCYVFLGRDMVRETQFISLPRLPSIHGHFQGA